MSAPHSGAANIWRDFETGTTGAYHKPIKSEIRDWGAWVEGAIGGTQASSVAAMQALDATAASMAVLTDPQRGGLFVFQSADLSAEVAADTAQGIYIAPTGFDGSAGAWVRVFDGAMHVRWFGTKGDGVSDDAPAFNALFAMVRFQIANSEAPFEVSLGGSWTIMTPINATGIVAWNLRISGGALTGKCTGKPILDLIGSRGYTLDGVSFFGDKTLKPSCAFQTARPTASGFCDNNSFVEVATAGWFSSAAIVIYGSETMNHRHCTYFNYEPTTYVAVFQGYNTVALDTTYSTVMSGPTSFINNKVDSCDFRYLPVDENIAALTGLTTGANAVATAPGHSFTVGQTVTFSYVGGMPNASSLTGTVTAVTSTTITTNIDTTGLGTYTSGGNIIHCASKSAVYVGRADQFNFATSYIVTYGQAHVVLDFPDSAKLTMFRPDLDILFEGSGTDSNIFVRTNGHSVAIEGFSIKAYNVNARNALINCDAGAVSVGFYAGTVNMVNALYSPVVVANASLFAFYGVSTFTPVLTQIPYATMAAYTGWIILSSTGVTYSRNVTTL